VEKTIKAKVKFPTGDTKYSQIWFTGATKICRIMSVLRMYVINHIIDSVWIAVAQSQM